MATKTTVAVLGLGLLGRGFAENLIAKGHDVRVWNRVLSDSEIAQVASCDGSGTNSGLVAAWWIIAEGYGRLMAGGK